MIRSIKGFPWKPYSYVILNFCRLKQICIEMKPLQNSASKRTSQVDVHQQEEGFFYLGFLSHRLKIHKTAGEGKVQLLFPFITSTRSRNIRYLFEVFRMKWLSRIFNRRACSSRTSTEEILLPLWISIWVSGKCFKFLALVMLYRQALDMNLHSTSDKPTKQVS